MRVLKLQIPKGRQPEILTKFLGNRNGYQNRVLAIAAGLLFFTLPAMISGGIILAQLFLLPGGYSIPRGVNNEILFSNVVWDFVPRIAVTGIIFFIGIFIVLIASKGFPDLENVMVGIGFLLIAAGSVISFSLSSSCFYKNDCDSFKYYAGLGCLFVLVVVGFVLPSRMGKKIGWFAVAFLPVLLYQMVKWLPYLFSVDQTYRTEWNVLKATLLLVVIVAIILVLGFGGGWPQRFDRQ
jgi:hypothetical protein